MADTKITGLQPPQTGYSIVPSTDVLPIVVVADPGMAASGSTRKATVNQLLGAGGTATLASATITGALTTQGTQVKLANQAAADCTVLIGPDSPSSTRSGRIGFITSSTEKNWFIANNWNVPGGFEITQSTAAGGSTLSSNPTLRINNNSDFLFLDGAGGTRMTLNSTGLGVGGSPINRLTVYAAASAKAPALLLTTVGSPDYGWDFSVDGSVNGNLFIRRLVATVKTDVLEFDRSNGNVGVGVTPAGTGGCLQLKSGITFPATQVASSDANTLDDYEEGTFTPTIVGTSATGVGVYTNQTAKYTKVGNLVTCHIYLAWTAHTGTGDMRIGGLPFATASASGIYYAASIGFVNSIALTAGYVITGYAIDNSSALINLHQYPTGGGASTSVPMDVAGGLIVAISYAT